MHKHINKLIVAALGMSMVLGLAGCSNSKNGNVDAVYSEKEASTTKALSIGDYDIYMDEVAMYAMQEISVYGLSSESLTDEDIKTNKEAVLSLLRQNKIKYNVAINNDVELNDSDKEFVENSIANFKKRFDEDILAAYGISDETVQRIFEEQAIVSKFENDIKNDMGQTIEEDMKKQYEKVKFHSLYYMLFPTVEIEGGNPKQNSDGSYVYVSDEEKEKIKKQAEEARQKIADGASYTDVAAEYGVADYSSERTGYVGSYDTDEMNKLMDTMKNGECMEVYEDTLGYAVIVMINSDDAELRDSFVSYTVSETLSSEYDKLEQMWLSTIPVDTEKDLEGTVWADFDFVGLVKAMEEKGIVGKQ